LRFDYLLLFFLHMNHGRQLRLFLADGTSSGPRFYEIVNRTIQALAIPATRIKELVSNEWPEIQKSGIYLVHGTTDDAEEKLYIGKGENVASRVQAHPDGLAFDVTSVMLFTSKDENLNASQVGWLESNLVSSARAAKKISVTNVQSPPVPTLPKAELATVLEFLEDLKLIAQTAGYDYFSAPKAAASKSTAATQAEFFLRIKIKNLVARGFPSDEGFVVKAGSDAVSEINKGFKGGYPALRQKLITQGVLVPKSGNPQLLSFAIDYAFSAPSAAAAVIAGNNMAGTTAWRTDAGQTLGDYLALQTTATNPSSDN
jgi:hypothetical protein